MTELALWPDTIIVDISAPVRRRLLAFAVLRDLDVNEVVSTALDEAAVTGRLNQLFEDDPDSVDLLRLRPSRRRRLTEPVPLWGNDRLPILRALVAATGAGTLDHLIDVVLDDYLPNI